MVPCLLRILYPVEISEFVYEFEIIISFPSTDNIFTELAAITYHHPHNLHLAIHSPTLIEP